MKIIAYSNNVFMKSLLKISYIIFKLFFHARKKKMVYLIKLESQILYYHFIYTKLLLKGTLPGIDKEQDKTQFQFSKQQLFPDETKYNDHTESIKKHIEQLKSNLTIKKNYQKIESSITSIRRCRKMTTTTNSKDLNHLFRAIRKREKYLKKCHKNFLNNLRENNTIKFELTFSKVLNILSVVTPLFFLSGVIYCTVLFSFFGLKPDLYLSTPDYINGSIHSISIGLLIISYLLIILLDAINKRSRLSKYEIDHTKKIMKPFHLFVDVIIYVLIPVLATIAYTFSVQKTPMAFILLSAYFAPLTCFIEYISRRYFSNRREMYIAILLSAVLLLTVIFSSTSKALDIINNSIDNNIEVITNDIEFNNKRKHLIFRSDSFYFFYMIDSKKTIIKPKNEILEIDLNQDINLPGFLFLN